jgi:predicted trehalose synthase
VLFVGTALRVRIATLKPGFVLVTAYGEALTERDLRAEQGMTAELDGELERAGQLTVFADLRESPSLPAKSRDMIAKWMRRHQARLNPSHVLVRSKIMEMAMSIVAMLVGGGMVKVYSKADVFLAAVRKAAPKLSELPGIPQR